MIRANDQLIFEPPIAEFVESRSEAFYTTFSGSNNSGKSLILKNVKMRLGSGLIDGHSQNMTVAARAMAEKKAFGHLS